MKHRFTQGLHYALPVGRGGRFELGPGWANQAFGNWQVNLGLTIQGGLPFTTTLVTSVSNAGGSRPGRLTSGELESGRDPVKWFDTSFNTAGAVWATPRQFTYGNGGRNILRGPGRSDVAFSVLKEFSAWERYKVQLRGEFFNLFNHPQFDLPNASIRNPNAGRISATVGTPRDIQLGLRLQF